MIEVSRVEIPEHYYSGIKGYENLEMPLFAAVTGNPDDQQGYGYAEVYRSGLLRLRTNVHYITEPVDDVLLYNPWTHRGTWSDSFAGDHPEWLTKRAQDLLRQAGAPPSILEVEPDTSIQLGDLDPHAGRKRNSPQRFVDQAFNALQFSRWARYEYGEGGDYPDVDRAHYADALNTLRDRFGEATLADSANHTITSHLQTLHTDMHTPGLRHKPHSDGSPEREEYMGLASQTIRYTHPIPDSMRQFGVWVNFLSLFGDADFWAVTAQEYPSVFNAGVDHLLALSPNFEQSQGLYVQSGTINPVKLVAEYFPDAYVHIAKERPDFAPEVDSPPALTVVPLQLNT